MPPENDKYEEMKDHDILVRTAYATDLIQLHLKELNGTVKNHETRIVVTEDCIEDRKRFGDDNRKLIIAVWGTMIAGISALATMLAKHVGL
jgi:hypothetical protein